MDRPYTPRRAERQPVRLAVQCATWDGRHGEGQLSDISCEGCCLRSDMQPFRVGGRIMVRPEAMDGLTGVIRWVRDTMAGITMAGIEFDRPISADVIAKIAQHQAPHAEEGRHQSR